MNNPLTDEQTAKIDDPTYADYMNMSEKERKQWINKTTSPKKQLERLIKDLLKTEPDSENQDLLLGKLDQLKKMEIPDNAAQSTMSQVEDYLDDNFKIRFNEISLEFENHDKEKGWIKLNENEIYRTLKKSNFKFSMADLLALLRSNYTKRFNPIRDYFNNLPKWDGTDHVELFTNYLSLGNEAERFKNMLLKWMVRSIACGFGEIFNKQAIVLIGRQNNGKSSLLRWLCPPDLRYYYKEDISTDKDSKIALSTNFIINIDELSTLAKKDVNAIKNLMSTENVKERIPYDRSASMLKRHANFLASTDRSEFLSDEAGSVRWICFFVDEINWKYSQQVNIANLWQQAYHYYQLGKEKFNYQLTREEIADNEAFNLQFYIKGDEHEAISACFERGEKNDHDAHITATDAIQLFKLRTHFQTTRMNAVTVGKAFKLLQFPVESKYHSSAKWSIKGYYVKFKDETWKEMDLYKNENNSNNENSSDDIPF